MTNIDKSASSYRKISITIFILLLTAINAAAILQYFKFIVLPLKRFEIKKTQFDTGFNYNYDSGHAFFVELPADILSYDDGGDIGSKLILRENLKMLGHVRSNLEDVRSLGPNFCL